MFNTVDHEILIFKLKKYGVWRNNLWWFTSFIFNWNQFIKYNNLNKTFKGIICGDPEGPIRGPWKWSTAFVRILRSNCVCWWYKLILQSPRYKFCFLYCKYRKKIKQWFQANKLSLNIKKTKYSLWQTSIHLFKVCWNEHLVSCFSLMYY